MNSQDALPLAVTFPLPFRVLFLVGLGILGWATNLHGLQRQRIDAPNVLELSGSPYIPLRTSAPHSPTLNSTFYSPIYRLFVKYSAWCFFTWVMYRLATRSNVYLVDVFSYIPAICALVVLTVLICPYDVLQKRERDAFLSAIRRCILPDADKGIYFADVVFADVLTSYAKVLGDVWLSICMLFPGESMLLVPSQEGWKHWMLPCLMSLPYFIRLRQCLIEYLASNKTNKRPLWNALKYASSFPVIFLSAAQRIVAADIAAQGDELAEEAWHGQHPLFRLWLLAAAVNSLYSFWWDVTNDWGLDLLKMQVTNPRSRAPRPLVLPTLHSKSSSISRGGPLSPTLDDAPGSPESTQSFQSLQEFQNGSSRPYPYGLRSVLLYSLPVYPLMIFFDLVLRLTWSVKLSSHLHSESEGSGVIFLVEVAEIVRRWMWVFLRVEWEVVKKTA
ncbi:EXS-domain-containing protein [Coniophora puteana RWD-64-598 SS2]|uniref:EXS-domain-containing protein n=1 Tax=Coniophora puteana (strain RWD-64-598) TaxID=741705 RepID=A0A5M3MVX1_CONPW|nr:EXS-domain-containing protein [Coniophora puteana RWD-64-598 SS2]EIW82874.1 EXS-domain-containing protein [Coniophora puteana RWD-64-598 SS2]